MNSFKSIKSFFNNNHYKDKLFSKYFYKYKLFNNYYYNNNNNIISSTRTLTSSSVKGWRKYAQQFRSKPASYLFTFAFLHEITAVIPIPIVYIALDTTGLQVPFPQQILDEGNRFINRVVTYYGYEPLENGSKVALNLATSYAIVKSIMPLRIAACVWMTPWAAEKIVSPSISLFRKLIGRK
nr:15364_t:CDS:2 [Entrophospora candida]CAG8464390.1 10039_t:CDS:2 [Entrophospora candida]